MARQVKRKYFADQRIQDADTRKVVELMGDHCFYGGIETTVRHLMESGNGHGPPVYQYMFNHQGSFQLMDSFMPYWKLMAKTIVSISTGINLFSQNLGVGHADELPLLFQPHEIPYRYRYARFVLVMHVYCTYSLRIRVGEFKCAYSTRTEFSIAYTRTYKIA